MADVTVLGVSGTTVSIPFTGVENAAAAQSALNFISNQVTGSVLQQVNYTGGSTLPAVGSAEGGVLAVSSISGLSTFAIGGQYVSAALGSAGDQSLLVNFGSNNATVVSGSGGSTISGGGPTVTGAGGAEIGNLGTNTKVFMGGAATQNFAELGFGGFGVPTNASATVWVTTAEKGSAIFDDSSGSTTINLDTIASSTANAHPFGEKLALLNSGNGQTTVNIQANTNTVPGAPTDGISLSFRATTNVATTVNAAGGSGVTTWALVKSGNAFINGNASEVILFPTSAAAGVATLFGGTGTDIDVGMGGLIQAGSGGNSVLFGSTAAGSTTLIGGGDGDVLWQQGAGDLTKTGPGAENLVVGGDTVQEGVSGVNSANIFNFVSGTDSISLANPAGGNYVTVAGTPGAGQVGFTTGGGNSTVNFGDGTTWTLLGVTITSGDFH